jgi:hypothetical protein
MQNINKKEVSENKEDFSIRISKPSGKDMVLSE